MQNLDTQLDEVTFRLESALSCLETLDSRTKTRGKSSEDEKAAQTQSIAEIHSAIVKISQIRRSLFGVTSPRILTRSSSRVETVRFAPDGFRERVRYSVSEEFDDPEESDETERESERRAAARRRRRAQCIQRNNIQLPLVRFCEGGSNDTVCAVCMASFEEDQMLRVAPCSHTFHKQCLDRWLRTNRSCPLCRHEC